MENSIYLGLSRQLVLRRDMDIIANNVANVNTPGFRAQNLVFEEFISDPRGTDDPLSFVYDKKQYQVTDPGSLEYTGKPLDIALEGPGFIGIRTADGEAYTRAGNFHIGPDGALVTPQGYEVADAGGATIFIPADAREIKIDERGFVSTQNGIIGQVKIVEFDNLQELDPLGNNLYQTDARAFPAQETRVKQRQLEGSNVKSVLEMTRMIDTLRSYQSVQNLLQQENDRLRDAIQKLTRVN